MLTIAFVTIVPATFVLWYKRRCQQCTHTFNPCMHCCIIFALASYHSAVDVQGMIAGATLGAIAFAALVTAAVVIWYRKRHYQNRLPPRGSVYEVEPASGASASAIAVATDVDEAEGGEGLRTEQFLSGSAPL